MTERTYVVTATCAVIFNEGRSAATTVRRGGVVPPGADPEHLAMLIDRGMVAEGELVGGIDHDPDAAPPFPQPAEDAPKRGRGKADSEDA